MKHKFYVTSVGYNVMGDNLELTLCEYNDRIEFRQPSFERCWTEVMFKSELEALIRLRELYPERLLTVFEDTGKIVTTHAHESSFSSMKIRKERSGY